MGFWKIMNVVAWGLCGLIAFQLIADVVRVETARMRKTKKR
ncbi:hypothetical protein DSLASN_43440 [Desulfoluna limicola]|uniref:Uncharacterized protein n=1 Tax=Desulfoluna limicola TaxID=2810562 RepID=A0ABM7PND5_9BACT|nr:hypothetical protein [Desulfoluna limicola]BCS98712.1 hypothetical protein DSLASN_43440 [Desulfoluna limicola]